MDECTITQARVALPRLRRFSCNGCRSLRSLTLHCPMLTHVSVVIPPPDDTPLHPSRLLACGALWLVSAFAGRGIRDGDAWNRGFRARERVCRDPVGVVVDNARGAQHPRTTAGGHCAS